MRKVLVFGMALSLSVMLLGCSGTDTSKEAKDMITKTDKSRASYYNYYTNKKWGAARSYNLCIDSSKLGIDYAIEAIIESIKIFDRTKISK